MPHGDRLTVSTENFVIDQAFIRRYAFPVQPGHYVCLTVTDTGIGMGADIKARAFEAFCHDRYCSLSFSIFVSIFFASGAVGKICRYSL